MVIIKKTTLTDFGKKHKDSIVPLNEWYKTCKDADWKSLADIKALFNNVDYVGNDRYVFNIKGNKYRLVAMIHFSIRTIFIRFIGTHKQYDKIDCLRI